MNFITHYYTVLFMSTGNTHPRHPQIKRRHINMVLEFEDLLRQVIEFCDIYTIAALSGLNGELRKCFQTQKLISNVSIDAQMISLNAAHWICKYSSLIRMLDLSYSLWGCKDLIEISKYDNNIQMLNLSNNNFISDTSFAAICLKNRQLKYLNISATKISDECIEKTCLKLDQLETLNLANCKVSNNCLESLSNNLVNLVKLDLSNCKNIEDSSVTQIARNCQSLTSINLNFCLKITDIGVISLAKWSNFIRELCLSHTQITNETMRQLSDKQINCLDISFCRIDDLGLFYISKIRTLECLDISKCDISDHGMSYLLESRAPLKTLRNFENPGISDMIIKDFEYRYPQCKVAY